MFFINLDNDYLLSSIKDSPNDIELNNIIFKIGVALMSWRNLEALKNNDNYNQIEETINRVIHLRPQLKSHILILCLMKIGDLFFRLFY